MVLAIRGKPQTCFYSLKLGGPYQVLAVCKYAIVPTTIGKTCLKITKTIFGYISGYPTHF